MSGKHRVFTTSIRVALGLMLAFCGASAASGQARNVILFVGDGFGTAQMALGLSYAHLIESRKLALETLMEEGMTGYTIPVSYDTVVIDSAASASQMATGAPARSETLGIDADGYPKETLLEWAERRGMVTGLVTNTRLTHATPAAFASHQASRYVAEQDIADEIVGGHDIEVLLGGGGRAFVPKGRKASDELSGLSPELDGASRRSDDHSLVADARRRGYLIASDRSSLEEGSMKASKLLGLFAASHLPYEIDRRRRGLESVPSLRELTRAALRVLERANTGFFVMIEGGRIDHAGHDNDAGTLLREVLSFDAAVEEGLRFRAEHPETLVIVTADHATGGFSFTYSRRATPFREQLPSGAVHRPRWFYPGKGELELLDRQKTSYETMLAEAGMDVDRLIEELKQDTGLVITKEEAEAILARNAKGRAETHDFKEFYADYEDSPQALLARGLARQTSVVWSTGGHTSELVLTFGTGPGAENLRGVYPNTRIYHIIREALGAP